MSDELPITLTCTDNFFPIEEMGKCRRSAMPSFFSRTAASTLAKVDSNDSVTNLSQTEIIGSGSCNHCNWLFWLVLLFNNVGLKSVDATWAETSHNSTGRLNCCARLSNRERRRQLDGFCTPPSFPATKTNLVSPIHANPAQISSPIPSVRSPCNSMKESIVR